MTPNEPRAVVERFFARWSQSTDDIYQSILDTFTPATVWENVGLSRTVGPDEAIAMFRQFPPMATASHMRVDMLAIAVDGNKVLTERRDVVVSKDGVETMDVMVMGVLEVEGGRITAWRDYFDTLGLAGASTQPR